MLKATDKPNKMPQGYFGWSLIDGDRGHVTLKDALHNLSSRENGDNHEYAKGLVIGVLSMLCATGMDYNDAVQMIWQHSPTDCHYKRLPEQLRAEFRGRIDKTTIPAT